ncbi:uncharacterized protein LOC114755402 [Neltuma alba]|uniref:uncharacterized protein LOC114755402 n=1 Tax=Neltuma alba TaxID=207710 RepID=UPI0010A3EA33|nr:uncharacterized protein LOC114755402 [Prosopis alba]XP_028800109.1 uncharacterized protein LOC114755402 [Prosopis alba]XP_028800110.1 uncharacterized protein LOC114755402 [Prosopis alba]
MMEAESCDAMPLKPLAKATLRLGAESYSVQADNGSLSEQIVSLKEKSMVILKDFITKHNAPQDVPDDLAETSSSEEDGPEKTGAKSKKTKLT